MNLTPAVALSVVYAPVSVAILYKSGERVRHIRSNSSALFNVFQDFRHDPMLGSGFYDLGNEIAAALDHAENDRLVIVASFVFTADVGFIGFDDQMTAQAAITINPSHVLADLVSHAPSGFVGHPELALELLGSYPIA